MAKAVGDEGESGNKVRYIPEHKKPDAALTFPEKLMNMMQYADNFKDDENYCIAWIPDGKSFVVRNPDTFTRQVLPKFFKATKFQSFTRKLYRWGFRQVNRGIGPDDPIIFGNEHFQRDDEELMVKMRSTTAASNRRARGDLSTMAGRKRSLEELDEQRKAILFERLCAEKAAMGGDPRFMANYGMTAFPPGVNPGYMPPMMMQRYFPMHPMPMHPQGEEVKEAPPTPGQEGGDQGKPAASPKDEQDIIESAKAALETAI